MGTLKVQDPPGSGNWVPVMPSVTGGLAFVARESYGAIYGNTTINNNSNATTNVYTPAVTRTQADLVFVKWDFNAQTTGNQQVSYVLQASVGGGAYFDINTVTTHNNSNTSPPLGCTLTGWLPITPGQTVSFRVVITVAGGGFNVNFGLANVSVEFFVSTGGGAGVAPEPDWGAYTNDTGSGPTGTVTGTATKIPWPSAMFRGVGVQSTADNGLRVAKAGIYRFQTDLTIQSGNAGWIIMEIRVYRAAALIKTFSIVGGNNINSGFSVSTVHGVTDLLAGDIAYVYATTSAGGTNSIDSRSQFTVHQIATTGATSGELTAGFRSSGAQSISPSTLTAVNLTGTPDHTCGGITIATNIVTVATAGVYQFQADYQWDPFGANARIFGRMEWWTGTAPAVGSGTVFANIEGATFAFTQWPAQTLAGQVYLPAGAQVRLFVWHSDGTAKNISSQGPSRLNVRKVSQGGQLNDTGWISMTTPTNILGAGWTAYSNGYELPAYKRVGNTVMLRGMLVRAAGAAASALTMPVGFRLPAFRQTPTLYWNGSSTVSGYFTAGTDGTFTPVAQVNAATYTIDQIQYDVV